MTTSDPSAADVAQIRREALDRLGDVATSAVRDPLSNAVRALAFEFSARLEDGRLSLPAFRALAKAIGDDASVERMRTFGLRHLAVDIDFDALVERAFAGVANGDDDAYFSAASRTLAGIVFTAHPTFAQDEGMRAAMAAFAETDDEPAYRERIKALSHCPESDISLDAEHAEATARISEAKSVNRKLIDAIIDHARRARPASWRRVRPAPISIATWVGYDLDGRTDIHWGRTFEIRLREKATQLLEYASTLESVTLSTPACGAIAERLRAAAALTEQQAKAFAGDLDDAATVIAAANLLTDEHACKLVSLKEVSKEIEGLLGEVDDPVASTLVRLISEIKLYGLGVGRIHLRVNAAQVRSTLQSDLGLSSDADFIDRTALSTAAEKSVSARRRTVNFGSIFREKMTARRQLMLCAQILKHVDADTPIRFLIAECEAPATIMGAIYLARLYGVEGMVDISPLFETPEAIESGGRFMERLLNEPEFLEYARGRGRISIQLGFSDSGRFMGQVPADLAIERLHILLAREMGRLGLKDIEAVVFNTHGESMGRGGYPGDLAERFDHLMTPWARSRYAREGIRANIEASFQGGDGFLHFQSPKLARATVAALFAWAFKPQEARADRFYEDINFSWDVYRSIKKWQEELFASEHYQTTLGAFAINFLYKTGSRKSRRQSGSSARDAARALRAIPHNAILQQLAAPCNVAGGFGVAAAREPERFAALLAGSERMRQLRRMAIRARSLTSLSVVRAYASVYDPSFWMIRARHSSSVEMTARYEEVSATVARIEARPSVEALANHLSSDRRSFDRIADAAEIAEESFPQDLYVLHAMRMALIMRAATVAASAPTFSFRHGVTRADLMERTLRLELAGVASTLADIFPIEDEGAGAFAALHEAASGDDFPPGYPEVRSEVIEPLRAIDRTLSEITGSVAHFYHAFG